jgi:entericidin B
LWGRPRRVCFCPTDVSATLLYRLSALLARVRVAGWMAESCLTVPAGRRTARWIAKENWMVLIATGAFAFALTGCNTMAGAGKDIERGGEKIQDAARKVRNDGRNARERHEHDYDTSRAACTSGTDAQGDACRDRTRADYSARMIRFAAHFTTFRSCTIAARRRQCELTSLF